MGQSSARSHIPCRFFLTSGRRAHRLSLYTWAQKEGYKEHTIRDFMDSADPFLVGAAASVGAMVVTQETPAGNSRKKVKIPDACEHLGVLWEHTFDMMRSLGARFT